MDGKCRFCIESSNLVYNIFDPNGMYGILILDVIKDLLQFDVSEGDGLPTIACGRCLKEVFQFKAFKTMCLRSRERFLKMNAKEEANKIDDPAENHGAEDIDDQEENEREFIKEEVLDISFEEEPHSFEIPSSHYLPVDSGNGLENLNIKEENVSDAETEMLEVQSTEIPNIDDPSENHRPEDIGDQGKNPEENIKEEVENFSFEEEQEIEIPSYASHYLPVDSGNRLENLKINEEDVSDAETEMLEVQSTEIPIFMEKVGEAQVVTGHSEEKAGSNQIYDLKECSVILKDVRKKYKKIGDDAASNPVSKRMTSKAGKIMFEDKRRSISNISKMRLIYCDSCMACFLKKTSLKNHYTQHHILETPFKCDICNACFSGFKKFRDHLKMHGKETCFRCSECHDVFYNKTTLFAHLEEEHGSISPEACEVCCKGFSFTSDKSSHMCNMNSMSYRCRKCFGFFKKCHNFKTHSLNCLFDIKCHMCNICGMGFPLLVHLKRHRIVHGSVKDQSCNLFPDVYNCPDDPMDFSTTRIDIEPDVEKYVCKFCHASFNGPDALKEHEIAMHQDGESFKCSTCSMVFNTQSLLKQHSWVHSLDDVKVHTFTCGPCGKVFKSMKLLERHLLIHSQSKPFKCQFCPAEYKFQKSLRRHETVNHREGKKFAIKCKLCEEKFTAPVLLARHLLSHCSM